MTHFTYFACKDIEEGWYTDMTAHCMAEQAEYERDTDTAERMQGRCDLCQEQPKYGLTIDGGLALCDGCLCT